MAAAVRGTAVKPAARWDEDSDSGDDGVGGAFSRTFLGNKGRRGGTSTGAGTGKRTGGDGVSISSKGTGGGGGGSGKRKRKTETSSPQHALSVGTIQVPGSIILSRWVVSDCGASPLLGRIRNSFLVYLHKKTTVNRMHPRFLGTKKAHAPTFLGTNYSKIVG